MNIGFDAKRAFLNQSGLGNYSRTLIQSLAEYFPHFHYSLFTPQKGNTAFAAFVSAQKNISVVQPESFLGKKISPGWRSYGITRLLTENKTDVYHGLSNELPFTIRKFKGKKIVTIHDLIFLRYPALYPLLDRTMYNKKFKSACELADVIVATSQQTKNDIREFYSVNPEKIKVVYQSCAPVFYTEIAKKKTNEIKSAYHLPEKYLLSVGTIEERKNLLSTVKALRILKDISLVVIGKKKPYFKKVEQFISKNKLEKRVRFLDKVPDKDMPALYQSAEMLVYPSLFEGFGIPIIEALTCSTPVITTRGGCFAEAGGKGSVYIDPVNHEQLAEEINNILFSPELRKQMAETGFVHSKKFLPEVIANEMTSIYSGKLHP